MKGSLVGLLDMLDAVRVKKPAAIAAEDDPRSVDAPVSGRVIPLSEVSDPVFSQGMLGCGLGIVATGGVAFAPGQTPAAVQGEALARLLEQGALSQQAAASQEVMAALGLEPGVMDDRLPLDRATLAAEVQAAQATRATQSVTDEADRATYTPGYILQHLPGTALLLVRSAVQNGDHYLRTLVGGSLSYYTLDLAWGWVAALYLLLAFAALPARDAAQAPAGALRAGCALAAVLCCLLAVAGCLLWTPVQYETLYGLQGRYFLPVLPLLLLTCWQRRLAGVDSEDTAAARLLAALALVQFGVLMNAMLAVIAR